MAGEMNAHPAGPVGPTGRRVQLRSADAARREGSPADGVMGATRSGRGRQPGHVARRRAAPWAVAWLLALAATASVAHGQEHDAAGGGAVPPAERPRVGLVLSGGAAKGIAHIGAIRVLEEAGLPIDVVAGTSMGSIVGGLYAVGYTPEMMTRIVSEQDWTALLTDATPRDVLDIERRLHAGETLVSIPTRGRSLDLPSGVVQGQRVMEMLARLTWPFHHVDDFTRLPRPFAAVVADLRTGDGVPLTSGSLPVAIRTSMSIPTLFSAVVIDGRTYVDGGLARNLPAEDAVALGADVLVCVDVSEPAPPEGDEYTAGSLLNVLLRTATVRSEYATQEQRRLCDILIQPRLGGLHRFTFDAGDEWIRRGEAAARAVLPQIHALVERLGRPALPGIPSPRIEPMDVVALEVRGASPPAERLLRRRLALDVPARLTPEQVGEAIDRAYASGAFEWISYQVLPIDPRLTNEPGASADAAERRLVVDVAQRQSDMLAFGLRYDSYERAALLFALSLRDRLRYGSTTRLAARLGQQTQLSLDYHDRFGLDSPFGRGGGAEFADVTIDLFAGGDRAAVRDELTAYRASAYLSYAPGTAAFVRFGPNLQHVRAAERVGTDTLGNAPVEPVTQRFYSGALLLMADTRDHSVLPTRGYRAQLQAEWADRAIGSGATFQHYVADAELFLPATWTLTVFGRLALTHGRGPDLPPVYATFIGGLYTPTLFPGRFFPLFGARPQELVGRSGQLVLAGLRWTPRDDLFFELLGNAGAAGDEWTLDPDVMRLGAGVTAGLRTPIGPLSLTLAGRRPDDLSLGFSLGYRF